MDADEVISGPHTTLILGTSLTLMTVHVDLQSVNTPDNTLNTRPTATTQVFNNKILKWTIWLHHFCVVQRSKGGVTAKKPFSWSPALMNFKATLLLELSDGNLCRYDVLVRTLNEWFNRTSRVSCYLSEVPQLTTTLSGGCRFVCGCPWPAVSWRM